MAAERKFSMKNNGFWVWNDLINGIVFVNRDTKDSLRLYSAGSRATSIIYSISAKPVYSKDALFKDTVGNMSQIQFRKNYQRKVKLSEKEVVTLQDIKDVAIFTCKVHFLSPEFISYFHTKEMDTFLRSLIVYFQFYFQVWNKLQNRKTEAKRKLHQPVVTVIEDHIRDDLSDLRSVVARNYAVLLMGIGDAQKFHHMNNRNNVSLSDKDRRLFETFIIMTQRVVWIALNRKYLTLIEKEVNRLLRTTTFNPIEHSTQDTKFVFEKDEERILKGKACVSEMKLLHRSPAIQEILFDTHDFRLLATGVIDTGLADERQKYLEAAYSAPEELLEDLNVPVGLLGVKRKYFDPMLKPKELSTTKKRDSIMKPIPEFVIPTREQPTELLIKETLPKTPSPFQETKATVATRAKQCKLWREYIVSPPSLTNIDIMSTTVSYNTMRTSIAPTYSKYS